MAKTTQTQSKGKKVNGGYKLPPAGSFFTDTLVNFVTGLGTERDKLAHAQYALTTFTQPQLEAAYRTDWIARKIVDLPAMDSTRAWRAWQAEDSQIEMIEEVESQLQVQAKLKRLLIRARLFGGAAIIMGIDGTGNFEKELDLDRVRKGALKFLHVVSRYEIGYDQVETDLLSPWFDLPKTYTYSTTTGQQLRLHPSRVIRMVGAEIPSRASSADGWGDSILQIVNDAIIGAGSVAGAIANLVEESKTDILKMPGLAENLGTAEYEGRLMQRVAMAAQLKSILRTTVIDSEEELTRIVASFASLPDVMDTFLMMASGAADIPATRMLGQSPRGLNATGESDIRNYYDRISSEQATVLQPALDRLDEVIIRTALGTRPPEIYYSWNPLWQSTPEQNAELAKKTAEALKIDLDMNLINPDVLREVRLNQMTESGFYQGIEDAVVKYGAEPEEPEVDEAAIAALVTQQQKAQKTRGMLPTQEEVGGKPKLKVVGDADWREEDHPRSPAGTSTGGQFIRREGNTAAYAGPEHGKEQVLFGREEPAKKTDLVLYRGREDPKEFGRIFSYVESPVKGTGGPTVLTSRGEKLRYRLETPEGGGTFGSLTEAMRRAEFLRLQRNRRIRAKRGMVSDEYDPNQPRAPAGTAEGGQWTKGGGIASTKGELVPHEPKGLPASAKEPPKTTLQPSFVTSAKQIAKKMPKSPLLEVGLELLEKAEKELEIRDPDTGDLLGKVKPSDLPWTQPQHKQSVAELNLTPDERQAVEAYTDFEEFQDINYQLRTQGRADSEYQDVVRNLESAINKSSLPADMVLHRGVSSWEDNFGRPVGEKLLTTLAELKLGDVIEDKGFMSTSFGRGAASDYGPEGRGLPGAMLEINAPKGTKGLPLLDQGEWVLQRGTRLRLVGKRGDTYIFEVTTRPKTHDAALSDEYDPNQPRAPAGTSEGGQWVKGGGGIASTKGELVPQKSSGVPTLQQTKTLERPPPSFSVKELVRKVPKSPLIEVGLGLLEKAEKELEVRDPDTGELLGTVKPSELPDPVAEKLKGALSPELKELTKEQLEKAIAEQANPRAADKYDLAWLDEVSSFVDDHAADGKTFEKFLELHPEYAGEELKKQLHDYIEWEGGPGSVAGMSKAPEEWINAPFKESQPADVIAQAKAKIEAEAKAKLAEVKKPGDYTLEFLEHVVKGSGGLEDATGQDLEDYKQHLLKETGTVPYSDPKELLKNYVDWVTNGNGKNFLESQADYVIHDDPDSFQGPIHEAPKWVAEVHAEIKAKLEADKYSNYTNELLEHVAKKIEQEQGWSIASFKKHLESSTDPADKDLTPKDFWKKYLDFSAPPSDFSKKVEAVLSGKDQDWSGTVWESGPPASSAAVPLPGPSLDQVREELFAEHPALRNFEPMFDSQKMFKENTSLFRNYAEKEDYSRALTGLESYTQGSRKYNEPLREGTAMKSELLDHVRAMDSILENSPVQNPMLLYRGVGKHMMKEIEAAGRAGLEYYDDAYASASSRHRVAERFAKDDTGRGKVYPVVVVPGSYGLPVRHLSMHPDEYEVVLARRTRFRIRKTIGGATYLEVVPSVQ